MMTEKLFVEFCQGEKEARKDKIIEELEQIERWEDAKSAATKHYNELIKESDLRIKDLRAELSAGGTEEDAAALRGGSGNSTLTRKINETGQIPKER
jgi:hypothetical protein